MQQVNPAYPTRFGNPFRSFAGATCIPPTSSSGQGLSDLVGREVNATILRPQVDFLPPPNPPTPRFLTEPLFRSPDATTATPSLDFCNTDRNPFFRYRNLMRLGNLVTTRSNVYAVWITVGYFEVEPPPANVTPASVGRPAEWLTIYPEGYALGRELGIDTGEVKRHRAFYIIDRSVPVGFQRGKDLNVDKAILVNRFIE